MFNVLFLLLNLFVIAYVMFLMIIKSDPTIKDAVFLSGISAMNTILLVNASRSKIQDDNENS